MSKVEDKPRSTLDEAVMFAITEAQLLVLQDHTVDRSARELLRWVRRRKVLEMAVQRVTDDATLVPDDATRQKVEELLAYALATGLLY